MRVAFLSSYTVDPLARHIVERARKHDLEIETWVAPFDTWMQQLVNPKSELMTFVPDVTIIAVDVSRIPDIEDFVATIKSFADIGSGKLIVHACLPEQTSVRDMQSQSNSQRVNDRLRLLSSESDTVFFLDLDNVIRRAGVPISDPKMELLAAMKWSEAFLPHLADAHLSFLVPMAGKTRKVLVLDLDGTLWGGVIGEDGMNGIALGPQAPGNAYVAFQRAVKAVQERGIVLAVVSKNNPEDALAVIREHPSMVVRESDFVAMRINWDDKVTNMRSIADELNVGLDSFVFFDDDPGNRLLVEQEAPEILVVDVPADPARYVETLLRIPELEVLHLTDEDKTRTEKYTAERARTEAKQKAPDMNTFLRSLEMKVQIREDDTTQIPRLAQLTQKTNQFNVTTKRYTEEEMRRRVESSEYGVWSIRVVDRFGDNGIVGLAVVRQEKETHILDTFLLSCRVLGRGVEQALLASIISKAQTDHVKQIIGEFIPTAKNDPANTFFSDNSFTQSSDGRWVYDVTRPFPAPDWIQYE